MATPDTASEQTHPHDRGAARLDRVAGARLVFFAVTAVLVVFVATGALSLTHAAIGVAVAAAAALLGEAARQHRPGVVPEAGGGTVALASGPIEAMLAGLPDPVVALDRDGIVIAFNPPAT